MPHSAQEQKSTTFSCFITRWFYTFSLFSVLRNMISFCYIYKLHILKILLNKFLNKSKNPLVRTYFFPSLAKQVLIFGGSYWQFRLN